VAGALGEGQQLLDAAQRILDAHKQHLGQISQGVAAADRQVVVVATGGTATTLAALHQQLQQYSHDAVHMSVLRTQHIQQLMQQYLHAADVTSRPGWLTTARAAALAPGCAGLLVLLDWLGVDQLLVSDADLLDGAVAAMVESSLPLPLDRVGDQ
jgi:exopolyphosphatase/pppGpp-phosphohydrolase